MSDKMKTGPGTHPDRQTKTAEPTRRSLLGLSDAKSKGELTVHKPAQLPVKSEKTDPIEKFLDKPQTRRQAMETGRNAVAATRMVGKIKPGKLEKIKTELKPTLSKMVEDKRLNQWHDHMFGKVMDSQYTKIKKKYGEEIAKHANYGWGDASDGEYKDIATKVYHPEGPRVLKSGANYPSKKVYHTWEDDDDGDY